MPVRVDILPNLGGLLPRAYNADAVRWPLKAIPGLRWDRQRAAYVGAPHAVAAALEVLRRSPEVHLREAPPGVQAPRRVAGAAVRGLRPHQQAGAMWVAEQLARTGAGLLADDMGLGKTAQAIRAVEPQLAAGTSRAHGWILVIAPGVVGCHWTAEVGRWGFAPMTAERCVVQTVKKIRSLAVPATDFRIITPDLFRRWGEAPELEGPAAVIVDEAHYYANARAKRTAALASYLARQERRPKLLMLTGTPLTARPRDLFSLLDLMHPGAWGSYWQFTKRYCAGRFVEIPNTDRTSWEADGVSHVDELRMRLEHVMLRRSKAEVGGLPPKIRSLIQVELPAAAHRACAAAAREVDGFKALGRALGVTEQGKIAAAVELAESTIEQGGKPLIFTAHRKQAQEIAERLNVPCVTGADAAEDRAAKIEGAPAAVCTMFSVTTGINLSAFDTVIFAGLHWVPSTMLQAEARPHRIGQTRTVTIYYLVALGTVDEAIQKSVIDRLDLFDRAIGKGEDGRGMATALNGGTEDDLIGEIIANIAGKKGE